MSSLDVELIREIRSIYTEDAIDFIEPPNLKDLAESRGVPYKLIKKISESENWEGLRNKHRNMFNTELAKKQEEAIQRQAVDVVSVMENTIKHNLAFLYKQLPQVKSLLENKVETMSTKELMSYLRLLLLLEDRTISIIERAYKSLKSQPKYDDLPDLMEILKNPTDITDIIDTITEEEPKNADFVERDQAFKDFDE